MIVQQYLRPEHQCRQCVEHDAAPGRANQRRGRTCGKTPIINPSYYEQPNPYINAPSCHVNLLGLSRYAKKCGKKLIELTQDEIKKFII